MSAADANRADEGVIGTKSICLAHLIQMRSRLLQQRRANCGAVHAAGCCIARCQCRQLPPLPTYQS